MKNKIKKGQLGYLTAQKKSTTIRTAVLFGISLAIYAIGYLTTKSNANYLTIVAVLGLLPACRSGVNCIMMYRAKGCTLENKEIISSHEGKLPVLYDLYLTSYEKNFEINHMAFENGALVGFSANEKCDALACEKHIRSMCIKNGIKDVTIKIFKDLNKYCTRLDQLSAIYKEAENTEETTEKREVLYALIKAISL